MRLIYERPANCVLNVDGTQYAGGEEFEVSDERGRELLAQPALHVRDLDAPAAEPVPEPAADPGEPPVRPDRGRSSFTRPEPEAAAVEDPIVVATDDTSDTDPEH